MRLLNRGYNPRHNYGLQFIDPQARPYDLHAIKNPDISGFFS